MKDKPNIMYNYGEIVTPYQSPNQAWDLLIGKWRKIALAWRVSFFALMGLALLLSVFLIEEILAPNHQILVTQITQKGKVINVAPLQTDHSLTQVSNIENLKPGVHLENQ